MLIICSALLFLVGLMHSAFFGGRGSPYSPITEPKRSSKNFGQYQQQSAYSFDRLACADTRFLGARRFIADLCDRPDVS